MTVAVPVHKRGHSSTILRSSNKRRLTAATAIATANVNEKDVFNVTEVANSLHLSLEAVVVLKTLLGSMQSMCCVYTNDFHNVHETHELQGDEDLGEGVDLLL